MFDLVLHCHARKTVGIECLTAKLAITITGFDGSTIEQAQRITPTIDWKPESTTEGSWPVMISIPQTWIGQLMHWHIKVSDNDVLICGYNDHRFNIVSSPLWDGLPGPYDISQHIPGGGSLGTGSLPIYAGQTVTFDSKVLAVEFPPAHDQKWWLITSKWPDLNGFRTDITDPNRYSTGPSSSSAILDMPE